jgi:hypothetical protein
MAASSALAGEPAGGEQPRQNQSAQAEDLKAQVEALRKAQEEDRKKQEQALETLRQKLDALEKSKTDPKAPAADTKASTSPAKLFAQSSLPDISLNADFLSHYSSHDATDEDKRKFRVREVELGFSGAVDPYGKYTLTLGFEEEAPDEWAVGIEEAYFTYDDLPYDLRLRVGKFRADFGKANDTHLHALPWIDYPLVVRNYFGEEGLTGTGASLSWLVPNPWDHYMELTGEVFNNDNESLFAGSEANDVTTLMHLKNFWDLTANSTLEVGMSAAQAPIEEGHGTSRTWIEGLDATYKWRPAGEGLYKSFELRSEVFTCQKDIADENRTEDSWGMYASAEYQFARRWSVGTRYDFSETPDDRELRENDYSAYLTFKQSEFAFWRLGYTFQDPDTGPDREDGKQQIFLQFNITFGVHPAHNY